MNKNTYILKLRQLKNIIKDEIDDIQLSDLEKSNVRQASMKLYIYEAEKYCTRLFKLMKSMNASTNNVGYGDSYFRKFIAENENDKKIQEFCEMFSKEIDKDIEATASRGHSVSTLLNRLYDAKRDLEHMNISSEHIDKLESHIKTMYTGVAVLLISITIFLMVVFFKSSKWQELKSEAKKGNWEKFLVILKASLSLGIITFPAILGITILVEIFGTGKYLSSYITDQKEISDILRRIERFLMDLSGYIASFIISPMIKLLIKMRSNQKA